MIFSRSQILVQIEATLTVLTCLFGPWVPIAHTSGPDRARVTALYREAGDLFRKANRLSGTDPDQAAALYRKCAMRYERILRQGGIRNGKLYYNLGNVYFRLKDIGRAIVNYRRAEQYIPDDPNLKQNLAYARKKRLDEIAEKQQAKVLKTLFFWHYDLSTKTRVIAFTICFGVLWIFAGIRIFTDRAFTVWCIATAAVLSLMFGGSLVAEEIHLRNTHPGVIISPEVVARKGNSETYEPSFREPLHSGTEFMLIEDRGDWYYIELADGRRCWVPSKAVERIR